MVRASAKKLEHTGPAEKEKVASVPQREQLESTPEPPLPKEKRNRAVRARDRVVGESQVGQEPHLGKREGDQRGKMDRKRWTPQ